MRGFGKNSLVVAITLASHIVVTIHDSAFDVNLHLGPFVEGFGHRLRVGSINNVEESTFPAIHHIQTLLEHLTLSGTRNKVVACTTGHIECCSRRNILIHKDIERVVVLRIDAGRIAHIRASGCPQLTVPIACVAIGFVVVDAEILLVSSPTFVLQLEGYGNHIRRHSSFG